jgi:hypothetical protein
MIKSQNTPITRQQVFTKFLPSFYQGLYSTGDKGNIVKPLVGQCLLHPCIYFTLLKRDELIASRSLIHHGFPREHDENRRLIEVKPKAVCRASIRRPEVPVQQIAYIACIADVKLDVAISFHPGDDFFMI